MQDCGEDVILYGSRVAIQVWDDCFVQADQNWPYLLRGTANQIQSWETFTIVPAVSNWDAWGWWACYGHKIALRTISSSYVQADFGSEGSDDGQLHAYDYTKQVKEWETFEIVPYGEKQPALNTPLKYGDRFGLKASNGKFVCCHLDQNERPLSPVVTWVREWEAFCFVDARAENFKHLHEEFLQQRKDLGQARKQFQEKQARQDEKEKALAAQEGKLAARDKELTTLDNSIKQRQSTAAKQEQELKSRTQQIIQQETDLQRREKQLVEREQFEEDWAEAAAENNQRTLDDLTAQSKELARQILERRKQSQLIEGATARITQHEEQLKDAVMELEGLPQLELLQQQIAALEVEEKQLQDQMDERQALQERLGELEANVERLLALANQIPELKAQVEALEQRLEGGGAEAGSLEQRLMTLSGSLLILGEEALARLRPELQEKLHQADKCELELRETCAALELARQRYQDAEPQLVERCAILRKYHAADALIAATLEGVPEVENAAPLLDKAAELLSATDRVLRQAIEANAEAKALETLRLGSE